jgi:hypothetical protein
MYYKCKKCEHTEFRGILPGATCGVLLAANMGLSIALAETAIDHIFPSGLGYWWLIAAPLLVVFSFFGAIAIQYLLSALEWLLFCLCACPKCKSRKWSFGFTQGFGL